jgi:microcystin-dependent protein
MIPSRNFDNFPTFASAGSRVPPDNAKYAAGFVPNDTYPAAWANYFLHGATKGISDLNPVVKSLIDECNEVVIRSGQTPNAADNTQLYTAIRSFSKDRINIANDTILTVNADTVARITANSVITITLADSVIVGASLRVYNTSAYNQNLKARTPDGNNTTVTLLAGSQNTIEWDGAKWISGNAPAVGATFVQYPNEQPPEAIYPCSKWEELDDEKVGKEILAYYGTTAPDGYLICDGSTFNTVLYSQLYTVLGTNKTPDLRECTLKGIGENPNATDHVKAGGLSLGEFQDDRVQTHTHSQWGSTVAYNTWPGSGGSVTTMGGRSMSSENTGRSGATTEVKSVGVNYIIKAKSNIYKRIA